MEDELAPVSSLGEDDFDKAFNDMMNEPKPSEVEDEPAATETPEPIETSEEDTSTGSEEEAAKVEDGTEEDTEDKSVEQPTDGDETTKEPDDDLGSEEDETASTEDSTKEEPADAGFNFDDMPMNVTIPLEIKASGMKMKATMNELIAGFQKGMDYTQKMQELSGVKKLASIATSNGLSEEDLNLLVELKQGNKGAIAKLMASGDIDPMEIDTDEHKDYTPSDYSKDEPDIDMSIVVDTINADTEVKPLVDHAIKNMPEDMYLEVSKNSSGLDSLYKDIKEGTYAKVMPEVVKLQALYGATEPTLDTYIKVARQMFDEESEKPSATEPKESEADKQVRNSKRKKVASSQKAPAKKQSLIANDVSNLSEDDFEKQFAKLTGNSLDSYR